MSIRDNEYISPYTSVRNNTKNEIYRVFRANGSLDKAPYNVRYHLLISISNSSNHCELGMTISITNSSGSSVPTVSVLKDLNGKYKDLYTKTVVTSDGFVEVYAKTYNGGLTICSKVDVATDMQYSCIVEKKDVPSDSTEVTQKSIEPFTLSDGITVESTYKDSSFIHNDGNTVISVAINIPTAGLLSSDPICTLWSPKSYFNGIIVNKSTGEVSFVNSSSGKLYASKDLEKGIYLLMVNGRYRSVSDF